MNELISQVSHPVFLYLIFVFFFGASIFTCIVGVALALRSVQALRLFDFMNRSISVRRMMRPLSTPHYIDSFFLERPVKFGISIIVGATLSIFMLKDVDAKVLLSALDGQLSYFTLAGMSENIKLFLLVGNALCIVVGFMILFSPRLLSKLEACTNCWLSLRKSTKWLSKPHMEVDNWVLRHPTSSGIFLVILSLSVALSMYSYM